MNTNAKLSLLLFLTLTTTGCVSAAMSGGSAIYDHNNLQNKAQNHYICWDASQQLHNDPDLQHCHINVTSYNYRLLLTGQVFNQQQKCKADKIASEVNGVERVFNQLEIGPPISTDQQFTDAWITTKIKSQIIAAQGIDPSKVKVITENQTVYLLGTLTPEEADIAVNIARDTEGVDKVVRVFQYIKITDKLEENP